MKDMKKDGFLEEKLDSYFEGTDRPQADLSAAKCALAGGRERRTGARRRMWIALASACASLILVSTVLFAVLPSAGQNSASDSVLGGESGSAPSAPGMEDPETGGSGTDGGIVAYTLSEATAKSAGVGGLIASYGEKIGKLTNLALSSNISAAYTVYSVAGEEVLLQTDVLYLQAGRRVTVTVYTDLSAGRYRAAELESYRNLPSEADGYSYRESFLRGEYLFLGRCICGGAEYSVALQSSYEYAFTSFMNYLT